MFKKILSTTSLSLILSTNVIAATSGVTIPSGYFLEEYSTGAVLMINSSQDYHAIYVDLDKAKLNMGNLEKSSRQTNEWHTEYVRKDKDTFYSEYNRDKTFGFVNGQFFSTKHWSRSAISFAVKSNGVVYQDKNDKDGKRERIIYSLLQKAGKYYLKFGYSPNDLNNYTDLFVAWHRYEKLSTSDGLNSDNRTYMGVIPRNESCNSEVSTCELKSIVFLIAINKTISQSLDELHKFGIKYGNMARFDSGGSTQYVTEHNGYNNWEGRNLPHMIEILNK